VKATLAAKLTSQAPAWLVAGGDSGVVLSSRARLARNLDGLPFPGRATAAQRGVVFSRLRRAMEHADGLSLLAACEASELSDLDRAVLLERRLISREFCRQRESSGVFVDTSQSVCLMVNEEDHLRVQAVVPGLCFEAAWQRIDALDDTLSRMLRFAYDPDLGFLTACPTNVGTGLRISAMMHLPGLVLTDQMGACICAAEKLSLAVRGIFGEGTEAVGHVFQLSNQSTLGESELEIMGRLEGVVRQLAWSEENARRLLLATRPTAVTDLVGRAFGLLRHARTISSTEAVQHLFSLRLGVELQLFSRLDLGTVNDLMLSVQPGHLQLRHKRALEDAERDIARAALLREVLGCCEGSN
jgi:protein arginine kinase